MARRHRTNRNPEERAARREELLDACDRAVQRLGPATTMTEMAAEAGITKPILYRYFGGRDGVYTALAERYVDLVNQAVGVELSKDSDDPRTRIRATIGAFLALVDERPEVYRFLLDVAAPGGASETVTSFLQRIADRIEEVTSGELQRFGIDPAAAATWTQAMIGMARQMTDWLMSDPTVDRDVVVDHAVDLVWYGFVGLGIRAQRTLAG